METLNQIPLMLRKQTDLHSVPLMIYILYLGRPEGRGMDRHFARSFHSLFYDLHPHPGIPKDRQRPGNLEDQQ